jgi:hypothetical protein
MLNLSNVTLVAIDNTNRINGTIKSIHTCLEQANFGSVKLVTSKKILEQLGNSLDEDGIIVEEMIFPITEINEYSKYVLYELHRHVDNEYCLLIQDHAFIINPDAWSDEFYKYDYIGAPWPYSKNSYISPFGENIRVGNGGFSFRSKKLLEVPLKRQIPFDCTKGDFYKHFNANNFAEDGNICVHNRHIFIEEGCKFPPVEVAAKFSYETSVPENQGLIPFGFHFNLPPGITIEE